MNICYSILLGFCLFGCGAVFAQDTATSKHIKPPSWLPHPPERPSWLPHPPERAPRKPSTREPVRLPGFPNVLTVNLPSLLMIEMNPCVALGAEYERFITKPGMFSVGLAAYWYTAYVYGKPAEGYMTTYFGGYQAMPALLYHPVGNTRRVDISVGPCLALGKHREDTETRDNTGLWHTSATNTPYTALLGQFNLTGHHVRSFVFAMHLSAGVVLSKTHYDPGVIQMGVKVGKRF